MEFEVFITKQIEECKARLITVYHLRELTEIQTRLKTLEEVLEEYHKSQQ